MTEYKIIFRGKLNAEVPASEIKERLLKLYKDRHETVNLFFAGRPLIVRKHIDYQTAQKSRTILERAGVPCEVVEDRPSPPAQQEQKTSAGQSPAPQKETPSGRGDQATAQSPEGPPREHSTRQAEGSSPPKSIPSATGQASSGSAGTSLLKGTRFQNTLAAIMITMIILSAGIRIWALKNADGISPPDQVTANGNEVCVHFNHTLFFLTPDGRLKKRVALSTLGLKREPADLQLLKNGDFIIGNLEKEELLRCDGSSLTCRRIGPAGDHTIDENFKFLADEERDLLFISDTNNHALLVQGLGGSGLRKIDTASVIRFPNGLALDKEGRLWLSNTAEAQVLSFELRDGTFVQAGGIVHLLPQTDETRKMEELLKQEPGSKGAKLKDLFERLRELQTLRKKLRDDLMHTRPLAIAWDSEGKLWVAASDGFITTAGVRVFNPEGNQVMSLPLGKGSIPVDIATIGDRIVIADRGLFQFFSTAPGMQPSAFGDEAFQRELSGTRSELRRCEAIKTWAGMGIWLLVFGTVILVALIVAGNYRRRKGTLAPAVVPAPSARATQAGAGRGDPDTTKYYGIEFTGSGAEYFRIWIVNVFLTILTLGIYAAWAKVRTRRYFYRNTVLGGYAFDYAADPKALLKGYGIVATGLLLYYLVKYFNPSYSLIVLGLFSLVFPLLVYKSLRFFAHNSTYRNIRFRFLGSIAESYRTYLLYPMLIVFTLGLIVPYWEFRRKKYFYNNMNYGAAPNAFTGTPGPFYSVYIKAGVVMALLVFGTVFCAALIVPKLAGASLSGKGELGSSFLIGALLSYGIVLFVASFFQMYIYAWTTNYCLRHSALGEVRFESTLSGGRLFWIRISNIMAIVFSMGLLTPWAKVRRMKYIADNFFVVTACDLGDFASASTAEESSYGDAATEYLGFEIGL